MKNTPLVSVLIPAYNSREYIQECIYSVVNQSYANIEIVVVDDGSTDDTVGICRSLDYQITLIEQQNTGRGGARDRALKNANGEYIAFLDHDDLLINSSIEERVNFLESNKDIGWVFTDAMEFDEAGDLKLFLDQFPWLDLKEDNFSQLLKGCFPLTSTVMIQSHLLRRVGGFNRALNYGEDLELFLRLLLISKVGMMRKVLTRRRIHPGQAVSSTFDRWNSRVKIYSNFKPFVGEMSQQQKTALGRALKHSYFKLGEYYWGAYGLSRARSCFFRSIGLNSWTTKSIAYLMLLFFFPISLLRIARNLKRRIVSKLDNT